MILGAELRRLIGEAHHLLIVPVQEVHLEALHAHVGIMLHHLLHVSGEGPIARPKDDVHLFLLAIIYQLLQVNLRNHLQHVSLQVHRPTLVEDHVANAMLRRKVDVIFIGIVVDARTEIDTTQVPVVPPVPSHLARLDPVDLLHPGGRCQAIDHIAIRQLCVVAS